MSSHLFRIAHSLLKCFIITKKIKFLLGMLPNRLKIRKNDVLLQVEIWSRSSAE